MPSRRAPATPVRQGVLIDVLHLAEHPQWVGLAWETRGMALALMAMPLDITYRGTLPPETDAWRNALGLPSAQAMAGIRERATGLRGSRPNQEMEHAWTAWLAELTRWFRRIDDSFLEKYPHWQDCKGRWWHPLLEGDEAIEVGARTPAKGKTAKQDSSKAEPRRTSKRTATKSKDETLDYPPIRISAGVVKQQWDPPMDSDTRIQLWDAGIQALGGNEKTARSLLGSLIKEYGESAVAEAVAKLAVRASRPADPAAFLRKQVAIQAGETPGARAAASTRSKVVL